MGFGDVIRGRVCAVPLSEHEQKLLSQMEQQLLAEDPRFASAMRGSRGGPRGGKRLAIGAIGVIAGLLLIVAAVAQQTPLLAVPGFLLMLAGASYALSRPKLPPTTAQPGSTSPSSQANTNGTILNRFEERWDRRREQNDN